ncbi:MAG: Holliday junction branch migration protein RuvA [Alphaproteobacteria bacterium]
MIGRLSGILDNIGGGQILLDVGGVGYIVSCSARTLRQLPAAGQPLRLLIETQMREDAMNLYGFMETEERDWFRLLVTVQGVGAKVALAILGSLGPEQLVAAITAQDKAMLTQADGVGPKLAVRLMTELKDKVSGFAVTSIAAKSAPGAIMGIDQTMADALSALVNLGYRRAEAFDALSKTRKDMPEARLDSLIPAALRQLGRSGEAA